MRFAAPGALLAWGLLPLLGGLLLLGLLRQRALLERLGHAAAVRRLARSASLERRALKGVMLLAAGFFLIVALARPQWGRHAEPVTRRGVDVLLALDVSTSMLAQDAPPDRFTRARALAGDLARRLSGNRVGVIAFAGSAFVQCPLTLDLAAVRLFLDILEVGDVPDAGSDLAQAIGLARQTFPAQVEGHRVLVLITDGEDHEGRAEEAAGEAAAAGMLVYTAGVGTTSGGPIPLPGEGAGYKRDADGRVVTTRLDEATLAAIAEAGGGRFVRVSASLAESRLLAEEIDRMEKADLSSRIVTTHIDRYQFPLAVALLLLGWEPLVSAARRRRDEP